MTNFIKSLKQISLFPLKEEKFIQNIGLISIGVSLVIIVLIMSLFVLFTKQNRQKDLISDGVTLTSMVASYSMNELKKDNANKLLEIVNYTGSKSGLVYSIIMDTNQKIIARTGSNYVDNTLIAKRAASSNNHLKQIYKNSLTNHTIYEFFRPIYKNGKKEGTVRLGFSPDINPLFSDNDIRGILVIATLFFSLVPIFYYLVRRSFSSLGSLNNELSNLIEKNEFRKIEVNPKDGVGKLVERFNLVVSSLKDKCKQMSLSYEDSEVANKVLSYEKDRIESVIDNMADGIMVTDSVGSITLVNRTMINMMKFSKQEVLGKTVNACFDNKEILSFIEKNQFYGSVFSQKNLEIVLKQSGGENIVRISYQPLISHEESVMGNIIVAKDITVQKAAQRNQSDFIAHVSHELRTPLNTIKSYVEMLMDDEVNNRETKIDFFNTINDEADRLARLINNLLNISKIEMGSLMINKDLIKTRDFLEDIFKSVESQAISKNIKIELLLPDKLSSLVMDKDQIRIAILNVLSNAIKYTPEDGSITFRAEEDESFIQIDITDTGYGISEEEIPHIFDKFFRSSDEKVKAHTGNGLGLALCRDIIKLHDGKIDVMSNIGQGTQFTLTLPTEDSPRIKNYSTSYHSLVEK